MNCNICGMYFEKLRNYRKHKHCNKKGCNNKGFHNLQEYREHLKVKHHIEI